MDSGGDDGMVLDGRIEWFAERPANFHTYLAQRCLTVIIKAVPPSRGSPLHLRRC